MLPIFYMSILFLLSSITIFSSEKSKVLLNALIIEYHCNDNRKVEFDTTILVPLSGKHHKYMTGLAIKEAFHNHLKEEGVYKLPFNSNDFIVKYGLARATLHDDASEHVGWSTFAVIYGPELKQYLLRRQS
jgi:hypothetical protein